MAKVELLAVSDLQIEGVLFPSTVANPPGSSKSLFLAGAGVRSLQIEGKEIKFTSIGIYLEATALQTLAPTWKSKTWEELAESPDFFKQIVSGNFEKFIRVTMILPLTGKQYSDKVAENCVAYWKAMGIYTEAEAEAVEKFKEAFKEENFPPGSSILFTQSPSGTLTISFSTGSKEEGIENAAMAMAVLESIIGEHGVSPAAKRSLASRISELLKEVDGGGGGVEVAAENGGVAVKEDGGE